jgi:hypothetical protein
LRTWFSIDPQPASINPTINISIVFICAFLVDCGQIIRHSAIKNDSGAICSVLSVFLLRRGTEEECGNGWKNNRKIDRPPHRQA